MSVDIHCFVESYDKESNEWNEEYFIDGQSNEKIPVYDDRDYGLFGVLAGVRSGFRGLVEPRGLPDDLSDEVKEEWNDGEFFGETWYDYCELKAYVNSIVSCSEAIRQIVHVNEKDCMLDDILGDMQDGDMLYVITEMESLVDFMQHINYALSGYDKVPVPGDVRIVMWFDC